MLKMRDEKKNFKSFEAFRAASKIKQEILIKDSR